MERALTTGSTAHFLWCLPNHDIVICRVCALRVGRYGIQFFSGRNKLISSSKRPNVLWAHSVGTGGFFSGVVTAGMCSWSWPAQGTL